MTSAPASILARLAPGETLIWAQAAPADDLAWSSGGMFAFALFWNAVVWFVLIRGLLRGRAVRFEWGPLGKLAGAVFAAIFVLGGLAALWAASVTYLSSWSTTYALTDRRVIVAADFPIVRTDSYGRDAFLRMDVARAPDSARGDVLFDWGPAGKRGDRFRGQLRGVPDPEALALRIQQTLAAEPAPVD